MLNVFSKSKSLFITTHSVPGSERATGSCEDPFSPSRKGETDNSSCIIQELHNLNEKLEKEREASLA